MAPPRSLPEIFRHDRLLAGLTVFSAVLVWAPLFATRIVPNVDLGGHVGLASAVPGILRGDPIASEYVLASYPMPYSLVYAVLVPLCAIFSAAVAAKVLLALTLVLFPLAIIRFSAAIGRDPRLGLLGFLLAWENNVDWGFLAFSIGVSLSLFALARMHEAEDVRDTRRIWPITLALAFTHAQAAALFIGGAFFLAFARPDFRNRLKMNGIATLALWVGLAPWVLGSVLVKSTAVSSHYEWYWPPLGKRVNEFFLQSVDLIPGNNGRAATGLVFITLLMAPALLSMLPRRDDALSGQRLLPFVGYLVLLYWLLPYSVAIPIPQTLIHLRHATLALFAPIWLVPAVLRGRTAERLLLPACMLLLAFNSASRSRMFHRYDAELEPYFAIVAKIDTPSRIAVFPRHQESPNAVLVPWLHIGGYLGAATGSFNGTTWNTPKLPVHHRNRLGLPELDIRNEGSFDLATHGRFYDWIVLLSDDAATSPLRLFPDGVLETAYEQGFWHLYRIHHERIP